MRSNKFLFLVFLVLYLIAGLSLLITGSVAHRHAKQFADITGYSLMSSAGFIIALGVIIIILSAVGFLGAYKNRVSLLKLFIGSLILILLLQFIAVIIVFLLRNKAEDQLRTTLFESLPEYKKGNIAKQWDNLQKTWSCCGVNGGNDWIKHGNLTEIPKSCCIQSDCTPSVVGNGTINFQRGCYESARNLFFKYSKALGGVSIFFLFVEIAGLAFAILVLRDFKSNYGTV